MTKEELQAYIDKYKKLLLESVEWWQKYSPDTKHGGYYNYLGRDGKVLFTDKNVRQQGRFVLLFARAYNEIEKRQEWLDLALQGMKFIEDHCFEPRTAAPCASAATW